MPIYVNVCPDCIISDENQNPEMDDHYLAETIWITKEQIKVENLF